MAAVLHRVSRSLGRAREAGLMIGGLAADMPTRRALLEIYANLGRTDRYGEVFDLNLRLNGRVFPARLRLGDIFVLGEILIDRQYELKTPLSSVSVVVDAGANIGASALWFASRFPSARLHAFEPAAGNFALLEANLAGLPGATPYRMALGRAEGEITLHRGASEATHSIIAGAPDLTADGIESVPLTTLAAHMAMAALPRIDLLKLDVEGAEMEVLIGLGERIRDVGVIVGELHETIVDAATFYGFLKDAGFRLVAKTAFREGDVTGVHGFEVARGP
ncbi:MAG: FkbM family methyltransferase [Mangrovicoccus sp.]|nr:FkbM family methyltransferase [Mangrovicoccus sp.]